MSLRRLAFLAAVPALTWTAGLARADMLLLKDGRVVMDQKLARADGGIEIHFEAGNVLVPSALIEDALIEGEVTAPATDEEKENAAKGLVRYEGKWIPEKRRAELIQKRLEEKRKQFKEIAAHREWRNRQKETTKHFAFEYTIPPAIFANYRDLMEAYFTEFVKQWKISLPNKLDPLPVCLHIDYEAMMQIGGAGYGVLGYFRFVKPWECNFYYDRLDPELAIEVMFHETNHYLQKLIDLSFGYPHFPGESLAEYYGASHWDPEKKKLTTGLVLEGRLVEVQTDLQAGKTMGLKQLITHEGAYEHYTWGWTLVHFMMNDARYKPKFQKFIVALPTAKDVKREPMHVENLQTCSPDEVWSAFCRYLELKDDKAIEAFEKEWHAYIQTQLKLVSAHGLETAADRAASMYPPRPIMAKRLFQEAIDKGSQNPMTFHRYAELLLADKQTDKAIELEKKAIAIEPLTADFYSSLSNAERAKGDVEESRRLRRLAREIDPDNAWLSFDDDDDSGDKKGK